MDAAISEFTAAATAWPLRTSSAEPGGFSPGDIPGEFTSQKLISFVASSRHTTSMHTTAGWKMKKNREK